MKLLATVFLCICCSTLSAADCTETFSIDSVDYVVPAQWCGHKLDSAQIALPEHLVRIPEEFCFEDYRIYVLPSTRDAFVLMAEAAKRDSVLLIVDSGYRSASFQRRIIKRRIKDGQKIERILADVAPPGYSQHETGRALDLVPSEAAFAGTATYDWLHRNAREYGFVESYPENSAGDHPWEAWHWLYLNNR